VHYIHQPFGREPNFDVTSVNYDFAEPLARAGEPQMKRACQTRFGLACFVNGSTLMGRVAQIPWQIGTVPDSRFAWVGVDLVESHAPGEGLS
jgi:hypothetical protein